MANLTAGLNLKNADALTEAEAIEAAETLVRNYLESKADKAAADQYMKDCLQALAPLLPKLENQFEGQTLKLQEGRIVKKSATVIETSKRFDIDKLAADFPKTVTKKLSPSGVKSLLNMVPDAGKKYGISTKYTAHAKTEIEAHKEEK